MGAQIGIALAEILPGILGLISIEGSLTERDEEAVRRFTCPMGTIDGWERLVDYLEDTASGSSSPDWYLANVRRVDPEVFCRMAREVVERRAQFLDRFQTLTTPRLIILGEQSANLAPSLTGNGADLIIVSDAGHWAHVDSPDFVLSKMLKWFERLDESGGVHSV